MKLVISGDWHLARRTWAALPAVQGDAYRAADQIFKHCLALRQDDKHVALVLAGDVFDTVGPTPDAVDCLLRGAHELSAAGIKIYAIQGQHGRYDDKPWPTVGGAVIPLTGPVWPWSSAPCRIAGYDNMAPDLLRDKLKEVPTDVKVLVLHQMLKGVVPNIEGQQTWDLDPEWVPAHVEHVFLGDYHKSVELRPNHDSVAKGPVFAYTGSISMQAVDEQADKSFIVFDMMKQTWERVPLVTRSFVSRTCKSEEQLEKLLDELPALASDTLVLLRYDPRVPDVEKRARAANSLVHFLPRVLPVESETQSVENLEHVTLEGCLDLLVKRELEPELHAALLALLRAEDAVEALRQLRAQHLEVACESPK